MFDGSILGEKKGKTLGEDKKTISDTYFITLTSKAQALFRGQLDGEKVD